MVKLGLLALLLAACEDHHTVELLLGPDETTLSIGFQCHAPGSNKPLFEAAKQADGMYHFQVVIDFAPVTDHVPGCRGEDIVRTCKGNCQPQLDLRYCRSVVAAGPSPDQLLAQLEAQLLADPTIIADAPDGTVIIRAVTTLQTCAEVAQAPLSATAALGCAYSCPVDLDRVSKVSLYLDAFNTDCANQVAACAAFPATP